MKPLLNGLLHQRCQFADARLTAAANAPGPRDESAKIVLSATSRPAVVPRAMSVFTKLLALCAAPFAAACLHAAPASLDLSFGAGTGTAIVPIDSNGDVLSSMAIQPDGRILLGGYCVVAGSNNFAWPACSTTEHSTPRSAPAAK